MGRLLASMAQRDPKAVRTQLAAARHVIMAPVSAAAMESYARAYPHLVRLHMLQEVADAAALIQVALDAAAAVACTPVHAPAPRQSPCILGDRHSHCPLVQETPQAGGFEQERRLQWGPRLAVTQAGLLARGPILSLRRQLASLVGKAGDVGVAWLQQAKLCRAAGGQHENALLQTCSCHGSHHVCGKYPGLGPGQTAVVSVER
jgi:FAT domain